MDQEMIQAFRDKIRMAKEIVPMAEKISTDRIAFQEVLRYLLENNVVE